MYQKYKDLENGIISKHSFNQSLQSYLGFLKHANTFKLRMDLKQSVFGNLFDS